MKKYLLLTTALVLMSGNGYAKQYECPENTDTVKCWTCGDNCTLTLDTSSGHVVVEGVGDMVGAGSSNTTNYNAWAGYLNKMTSLEIKEGITSVGKGAFVSSNIVSAILPDGLTKIEGSAFDHASKLASLVIPDSVTSIGTWALGSTAIKDLTLPDSVMTIGQGALHNIPLKNVTCSGGGDTAKCDAILKKLEKNIKSVSRPNYSLDENGNVVERYQYDEQGELIATYRYNEQGELIATYVYDNNGKQYLLTADGKLSLKNADGSTYIYNKDGDLVGIKGKKIYTVEEAEAVTAHGDKFHVSLTYK